MTPGHDDTKSVQGKFFLAAKIFIVARTKQSLKVKHSKKKNTLLASGSNKSRRLSQKWNPIAS